MPGVMVAMPSWRLQQMPDVVQQGGDDERTGRFFQLRRRWPGRWASTSPSSILRVVKRFS
jgi:hypothetical protein